MMSVFPVHYVFQSFTYFYYFSSDSSRIKCKSVDTCIIGYVITLSAIIISLSKHSLNSYSNVLTITSYLSANDWNEDSSLSTLFACGVYSSPLLLSQRFDYYELQKPKNKDNKFEENNPHLNAVKITLSIPKFQREIIESVGNQCDTRVKAFGGKGTINNCHGYQTI